MNLSVFVRTCEHEWRSLQSPEKRARGLSAIVIGPTWIQETIFLDEQEDVITTEQLLWPLKNFSSKKKQDKYIKL